MPTWIYKCNSQNRKHHGDWNDFFLELENGVARWGSTEWIPTLYQAKRGDTILAYQTDRNELVGIMKVAAFRRRGKYRDLSLKPLRRIGVKVGPLKKLDRRINAIPAFKRGRIQTLYAIDQSDVQRLLRAAGVSIQLECNATGAEIASMKSGGGFGSFQQNKETEAAGMRHATKWFQRLGWQVRDVSPQNLGYDLLCRRRNSTLHVEVKGVGGTRHQFIITRAERRQWRHDKLFALVLVLETRQTNPTIYFYQGSRSMVLFQFECLSFMACQVRNSLARHPLPS